MVVTSYDTIHVYSLRRVQTQPSNEFAWRDRRLLGHYLLKEQVAHMIQTKAYKHANAVKKSVCSSLSASEDPLLHCCSIAKEYVSNKQIHVKW